jgi:hypothetical protein
MMRSDVIATQRRECEALRAVNPKSPKVEPIRQPTLFQMEKLEEAAGPVGEPKIERPYSLPEILLGISATSYYALDFSRKNSQP